MDASLWLRPALVFLVTSSLVCLLAWLWERRKRRRQWQGTVEAVEQAIGGAGEGGAKARGVSVLREQPAGTGRLLGWAMRHLRPLRRLEARLEKAAVPWGVRGFLLRAAGFGTVLALLLGLLVGPLVAPVGLLFGAAIPYLDLGRRQARRRARLEEQFPTAVDLLARAIRAGHPLSAGLKMVADESAEPLAGEFRRVFEEQRYGLPLQESLEQLADRTQLMDVSMFVTAVLIQREVGGNLAEILDQISETVRERFKIQRQVKVYTAQGRLTGILLALLPVGLGLLLAAINPTYMMPLFREPAGQIMLGVAVGLQLIGYLLIRRITTIEV